MSEQEYREHIFAKVKDVKTNDQLTTLIDEISTHNHDYGTIVVGCAAAMQAALQVVDNSKQGGITGFQASCLFWELMPHLTSFNPPCKLVDYNNMLYPQYEDKFQKVIGAETWKHLQDEAKQRLKDKDNESAHIDVIAHWKSISNGQVPFGYQVGDVE